MSVVGFKVLLATLRHTYGTCGKFFHQAAFDHARLDPEAPRIESGKAQCAKYENVEM